jgi:hypothetical protein
MTQYKVSTKWFSSISGEPVKEEPRYSATLEEARRVAEDTAKRLSRNSRSLGHEVVVFRLPERGERGAFGALVLRIAEEVWL